MSENDFSQNYMSNLHQIQGILARISEEANTEGVYLVDDSGFLIAETGGIELDRIALAALVAASFGATEEIAKLLDETKFTQLTQQGESRHLFICKAGDRHIVISVFSRNTNLGLVKLYVERAVIPLGAILDYIPPDLKVSAQTEISAFKEEDLADVESPPEEHFDVMDGFEGEEELIEVEESVSDEAEAVELEADIDKEPTDEKMELDEELPVEPDEAEMKDELIESIEFGEVAEEFTETASENESEVVESVAEPAVNEDEQESSQLEAESERIESELAVAHEEEDEASASTGRKKMFPAWLDGLK